MNVALLIHRTTSLLESHRILTIFAAATNSHKLDGWLLTAMTSMVTSVNWVCFFFNNDFYSLLSTRLVIEQFMGTMHLGLRVYEGCLKVIDLKGIETIKC